MVLGGIKTLFWLISMQSHLVISQSFESVASVLPDDRDRGEPRVFVYMALSIMIGQNTALQVQYWRRFT